MKLDFLIFQKGSILRAQSKNVIEKLCNVRLKDPSLVSYTFKNLFALP